MANHSFSEIQEMFKRRNMAPAFTAEDFDINQLFFFCPNCGRKDEISLRVELVQGEGN